MKVTGLKKRNAASKDAEKRRLPRLDYRKKSRCQFLSADGVDLERLSGLYFGIQVVNLSLGGACISAEGSARALVAKLGSVVELKVPIDDKNLILTGKVVWWEKTDNGVNAGLCFDELPQQEDKKLHQHINKLQKPK